MPTQEEFDELKGRIVELENALKGQATQPAAADLTADDLASFQKVRAALASESRTPTVSGYGPWWPPYECYECYCFRCQRCWTECTECGGGCLQQAVRGGGVGRFGGLGG